MSRRALSSIVAALALVAGLIGGPQLVRADGVGNAKAALQQAQDELDNLINQMGQLDEDYGAAQDQKAQVDADIVVAQAKVDEMSAKLGTVQSVLQDIAVTKFTTGGNSALSPLFSDAASFSAAEQKDAMSRVALDTGEATQDDLQSLVDDLAKEKSHLDKKQAEAASLVATLEQKQAQYNELEKSYTAKLAKAQADFGDALVAEQERRNAAADAAAASAAAAAAAARSAAASAGNGGGGATPPAPRGGGGASGSDPTPAPVDIPPVSGKAGAAVAAASGQLGVPYRFAAESPGVAFDCSGLTKYAWGRAGVSLPHQSAAQFASTPHVPKDQAQPGDLIYYYAPIGHVGIYIGGGQMIHAPATGKTVEVTVVHWNKVVGVSRPG
jgi:cell wall-associated NlpC family hydrolase